jgi:hypothetical protein
MGGIEVEVRRGSAPSALRVPHRRKPTIITFSPAKVRVRIHFFFPQKKIDENTGLAHLGVCFVYDCTTMA